MEPIAAPEVAPDRPPDKIDEILFAASAPNALPIYWLPCHSSSVHQLCYQFRICNFRPGEVCRQAGSKLFRADCTTVRRFLQA